MAVELEQRPDSAADPVGKPALAVRPTWRRWWLGWSLRRLGLGLHGGTVLPSGIAQRDAAVDALVRAHASGAIPFWGLVRQLTRLPRRVDRESATSASTTAHEDPRAAGTTPASNADAAVVTTGTQEPLERLPHVYEDVPSSMLASGVANVSIHPPSGAYVECQTLVLSCATPQSVVRFTIDGSEPGPAAAAFTEPFELKEPSTIRARAYVAGVAGAPSSATVRYLAGAVRAEPEEPGPHPVPLEVLLSTTPAQAVIRYTVDGSEPTTESPAYTVPLNLSASATLRARTFVDGWAPGPEAIFPYTVERPEWQVRDPADTSDPVPHNQTAVLPAPANRGLLVAASTRGRLHAHNGTWRDDSVALRTIGPWALIAVADGAGSASHSRLGAAAATNTALSTLARELEGFEFAPPVEAGSTPTEADGTRLVHALQQAIFDAIESIQELADTRGQPLSDFATTLLVAGHAAWGGKEVVFATQVGDGAVVITTNTGFLDLSSADSGAFAGETQFLTSRKGRLSLAGRYKMTVRERIDVLAVMSDGVADDYHPYPDRMPAMLEEVARAVSASQEPDRALAEWLGYERMGSSDDRSIALLVRSLE